jgi:hypothetical protein
MVVMCGERLKNSGRRRSGSIGDNTHIPIPERMMASPVYGA